MLFQWLTTHRERRGYKEWQEWKSRWHTKTDKYTLWYAHTNSSWAANCTPRRHQTTNRPNLKLYPQAYEYKWYGRFKTQRLKSSAVKPVWPRPKYQENVKLHPATPQNILSLILEYQCKARIRNQRTSFFLRHVIILNKDNTIKYHQNEISSHQ